MKKRPFNIKSWLLLALLCAAATWGNGQTQAISLEEALEIARKNYTGLESDRLAVEQQNKLAEAGLAQQPTQLFLTGEEFNFGDQSGVHSLNLQQNFYLPKAVNAQREYYRQGANVAQKQLALTDRELERAVSQAYHQLQFAKQEQLLAAENLALYNDFLVVTTAQMETGESGKIPQLAARSRLGQAQLEQEHALEKYQIALSLFNQWLRTDAQCDVEGGLPFEQGIVADSIQPDNPHMQLLIAQREQAQANVATREAQLLPQINSGARLQNAFGEFPLFGYQLGVNVPLFKKAYRGQIEAAELGVKVQEAVILTEQQRLERTVSELSFRLGHQAHILEYLQNDLLPIVNEQSGANLQAYREGEVEYLEYLDGLEQVVKVKQQILEALYNFNVLRVELSYWTGN